MGQKNSKLAITETDKAVLQLKRSKDDIHKFTKRTNLLINNEKDQLKQLIKEHPQDYKKNHEIRFLLKRIHYQEILLQQASDQLINLENMISNIEFKLIEKQFFKGIQKGHSILTKLNKEFNDLDNVLDSVQDQMQYAEEINNTLSQSIVGIDNFEDELDKELSELELEVNPKIEINMPSTENLPSPIEQKPKVSEEEESKEVFREEEKKIALSS